MIIIHSHQQSERLKYVLDFCFKDKSCEYKIISNQSELTANQEIDINYSEENIPAKLHIKPISLLFEDTIDSNLKLQKDADVVTIGGLVDDLAVIFYLISRYEEYQPHQKDEHGRYTAKSSQQSQLGILKMPYADVLVKNIWNKIELDYSAVAERFECVPSFDIDIAWAFKNKGFWRSLGGFLKLQTAPERLMVLLGLKRDPYDTYARIMNMSTQVDRIICFSLLSDWSKYDKNIHWTNLDYQSLIRGLNSDGGMGIHPGYYAHLNPEQTNKEVRRLEEITGHEIVKSRAHFLRIQLPESYEMLINQGVKREYSMGYADDIGFRAGTSFPYYFFNLSKNEATDLLIFPFAYMDCALKDQLNLSPDQSLVEIKKMIDEVKEVGGVFMCIWHNSSITDKKAWKGWFDVLKYTISESNKKL
jgi:hypothetical protein